MRFRLDTFENTKCSDQRKNPKRKVLRIFTITLALNLQGQFPNPAGVLHPSGHRTPAKYAGCPGKS